MRKRTRLGIGLLLAAASGACSAIIGLDSPTSGSGGPPAVDATTDTQSDGASNEDAVTDAGTAPEASATCAALSAGDAGSYFPFTQGPVDDAGDLAWQAFSPLAIARFNPNSSSAFVGGTFDGQYVYFPSSHNFIVRYDTHAAAFTSSTAWQVVYLPSIGGVAVSFQGAVFDGRYVTFVPALNSGHSYAFRFDTTVETDFTVPSSLAWESFDVATLPYDAGSTPAAQYVGGVLVGRFSYLVPHTRGARGGAGYVPTGGGVRYDTAGSLDAAVPTAPEGGVGSDGGDAGDASTSITRFANPADWTSFDLSVGNPQAAGFSGGIFAGGALYLAPMANELAGGSVNSGYDGVVLRYAVSSTFDAPASWTAFDTTTLNGQAFEYYGAGFDGRFVYFVPRLQGVAVQYDTTKAFGSASAWRTYDTTRALTLPDGAVNQFTGAAFDGRFIYYMPYETGASAVLRYDTLSDFGADCAWSSYDPSTLPVPAGGSISHFIGAVFDGQYLYLVPNAPVGGVFLRFEARSGGTLPPIPGFHGSFL